MEAGVVDSIPIVDRSGKPYTYYYLDNLFSKWGNEDGDNLVMVEVAWRIISKIEELGYEVATPITVHNDARIDELRRNGKTVWVNEWCYEEVWRPEVWEELWKSLPEDVRELLVQLSEEGIPLDSILF